MEVINQIVFFVIGLCFGSFLSVVTDRIFRRKKGIFFGQSECPKCKHKLTFLNLIPLLSWLMQKGKCSYCKKPISVKYPALELITGLLFLSNYNFFFNNSPLLCIYYCLVGLVLMAICFSDLEKHRIPNIFLYLWIVLTIPQLLLDTIPFNELLIGRLISLTIVSVLFGGQYLVSKGKWLGSGDLYIAFGMAIFFNWPELLVALAITYLFGGILGLILILTKKLKLKQAIPFAPLLTLGILIALYHGADIAAWYASTLLI